MRLNTKSAKGRAPKMSLAIEEAPGGLGRAFFIEKSGEKMSDGGTGVRYDF